MGLGLGFWFRIHGLFIGCSKKVPLLHLSCFPKSRKASCGSFMGRRVGLEGARPRTTTNNHELPRTTKHYHERPRTATNNHARPHARPRTAVIDNELTTTHGHARPRTTTHDQVFRALSEAVHVVPPCERLNTRLMPVSQQPTDVIYYSHRC